jgi:hypothetical protein
MPTQAVAGFNSRFYTSPDGGTTWHEVGEMTDIKKKRTVKMLDATSHTSAGDEEYIPGTRGFTGTATVLAVASDVGQIDLRNAITPGTKLKIRVDPYGSVTGRARTEGFAFVEDFEESGPNAGIVGGQISLRGTGAVTETTVP